MISTPIQKVLWKAGDNVSNFFVSIIESKYLKRENDYLKSDNKSLLAQISFLKEKGIENEILRKSLNIGLEKDFKLDMAEVVSKDAVGDYLLINKGFKDGISKKMPVITEEKAAIGIISDVYANFSKVMLISNKESVFDAEAQSASTSGLAKGEGGLKMFFDLVPKEKEIQKGDSIVTTALGGVFPEGILVGKVEKIEKSDVRPFQTIEVVPIFNIKGLDHVFIITSFYPLEND